MTGLRRFAIGVIKMHGKPVAATVRKLHRTPRLLLDYLKMSATLGPSPPSPDTDAAAHDDNPNSTRRKASALREPSPVPGTPRHKPENPRKPRPTPRPQTPSRVIHAHDEHPSRAMFLSDTTRSKTKICPAHGVEGERALATGKEREGSHHGSSAAGGYVRDLSSRTLQTHNGPLEAGRRSGEALTRQAEAVTGRGDVCQIFAEPSSPRSHAVQIRVRAELPPRRGPGPRNARRASPAARRPALPAPRRGRGSVLVRADRSGSRLVVSLRRAGAHWLVVSRARDRLRRRDAVARGRADVPPCSLLGDVARRSRVSRRVVSGRSCPQISGSRDAPAPGARADRSVLRARRWRGSAVRWRIG